MTDFGNKNTDSYPHTHLSIKNTEVSPEVIEGTSEPIPGQVIDIQTYLQTKTLESSSSETVPDITLEVGQIPKALQEKRLESIFAVVIGSIITVSIMPISNNIDSPKIQEGISTGILSLAGWGIFYASIPYLQDSKLGRIISRKDKKLTKSD